MKVLDRVWMVVMPCKKGVIYCISNSPAGVWAEVEQNEVMGTGITKNMLHKLGYRARQVSIVLPR